MTSGAEIFDTPTTTYAYTDSRGRNDHRSLVIWCWSHTHKRWGSCVNPKPFSDYHWGQQTLPEKVKTFTFHRGLTPYDAGRKMGVIK